MIRVLFVCPGLNEHRSNENAENGKFGPKVTRYKDTGQKLRRSSISPLRRSQDFYYEDNFISD